MSARTPTRMTIVEALKVLFDTLGHRQFTVNGMRRIRPRTHWQARKTGASARTSFSSFVNNGTTGSKSARLKVDPGIQREASSRRILSIAPNEPTISAYRCPAMMSSGRNDAR